MKFSRPFFIFLICLAKYTEIARLANETRRSVASIDRFENKMIASNVDSLNYFLYYFRLRIKRE